MNYEPKDPAAFAHAVRYRDAMLRAWAKRTGRMLKGGWLSYHADDIPSYLDVPTNADRSKAETSEFVLRGVPYGETYTAYLIGDKQTGFKISTFTGEKLADVTRITHGVFRFGRMDSKAGRFRAIGIDGRAYYGSHNGAGYYCRMRLAKYRDDYDIQQHTHEGWEVVSSEDTRRAALRAVREYQENQPELSVRFRRVKVSQVAEAQA